MLERGVSPDARDPDDKDQPTLLISACYYADLPLVRLLLESGADVHLTDASGGTALMSAALTLSLSESSLSESAAAGEVVASLLRVGARLPAELPPGAADRGWGAQWTAMHKSVSEVAFVRHGLSEVAEWAMQARREAAGAESPASRPSALAAILARGGRLWLARVAAAASTQEAEREAARRESVPGAG